MATYKVKTKSGKEYTLQTRPNPVKKITPTTQNIKKLAVRLAESKKKYA